MNEFFADAKIFFNLSLKYINPFMRNDEVIESTLLFALGLERVFKGIIYNINPIYILKEEKFGQSASLFYKKRMIKSPPPLKEVNFNPKGDLINFRESLSRARYFSNTANLHSSLFNKINSFRDLIAHCELSKLDNNEMKTILNRDFPLVINSFSKELALTTFIEFDDTTKFNAISEHSCSIIEQEKLAETIQAKLQHHKKIWEERKKDKQLIESINNKVSALIGKSSRTYSTEEYPCPACDNSAIVTFEYEPAYAENEEIDGNFFLNNLHCLFCDLNIDDYKELEHMSIEENYWESIADSVVEDYLY